MKALILNDDKEVKAEAIQGPDESDTDFYTRVHNIAHLYNLRVLGHFDIEFMEEA